MLIHQPKRELSQGQLAVPYRSPTGRGRLCRAHLCRTVKQPKGVLYVCYVWL
jgi:hypothetical protein